MSAPTVTSVTAASPAARAGLAVGDELLSLNGHEPRDVIEFQQPHRRRATSASWSAAPVRSLPRLVRIDKEPGEPLGVEVSSAVFDRIRTCDNHCAFCFIYQLPKGMRRSLYLKDDDYRLSFLYGNFTTLTRFTELDAERILTERLGPLFVSIHTHRPRAAGAHAAQPQGGHQPALARRSCSRGASRCTARSSSARASTTAPALEDTMAGILDRYPALASVGAVPLGLSRYSKEPEMRPHTPEEAARVLDTVEEWQGLFRRALGRRMVFAADEYYLLAGRDLPPAARYDGLPPARERDRHGAGLRRLVRTTHVGRPRGRAPRVLRLGRRRARRGVPRHRGCRGRPGRATDDRPVIVLTGTYGARVLAPLLAAHPRHDVERARRAERLLRRQHRGGRPAHRRGPGPCPGRRPRRAPRCLLPDACLNEGRFLDGLTLADLPRPVEVVPTDGRSLRARARRHVLPARLRRHEPRWSWWPAGPTSASRRW